MTDRKPLVVANGEEQLIQSIDRLVDADGRSVRSFGLPIFIDYTFSTTITDSDPGNGVLRLDNATQSSAGMIRADLLDAHGKDVTNVLLDIYAGPGGGVLAGSSVIRLYKTTDYTKWIEFFLTDSGRTASGYDNIGVGPFIASSAASPFADGDPVTLVYYPAFFATFNANIELGGIITPAQITSDQNNYAPTGFSTASTLRLNSDTTRTITGLAGGVHGKLIIMHNTGVQDIVLANASGSSTATNRFAFTGTKNAVISGAGMILLQYDGTTGRWRSNAQAGPGFTWTSGQIYALQATGGTIAYTNSDTFTTPKIARIVVPSDATNAFLVANAANSAAALVVDTNNFRIGIGNIPTPLAALDIGAAAGVRFLVYGYGATPGYWAGMGINLGQGTNSMGFFTGQNSDFTIDQNTTLETSFPYSSYTTAFIVKARAGGSQVGIGTVSPSAKCHVISTTEQQRLGYDTSNYVSFTVSSTGLVTLTAVGADAGFVFSQSVRAPAIATGSISVNPTADVPFF